MSSGYGLDYGNIYHKIGYFQREGDIYKCDRSGKINHICARIEIPFID